MEKKQGIGFFERYLTIWVALCIVIGIAIGQYLPVIPQTLSKFEYANVSIPVEQTCRDVRLTIRCKVQVYIYI